MYTMQFHSLFHVNYFINAFFLTYLFSFSLFFFVRGSASGVGAHVHHIFAIISEHISKPNGMSICTVYWSIRIVSFCSYCCGRLFFFGCLFCLLCVNAAAKLLTKFFCSSSFSFDLYSIDFINNSNQQERFMCRKYI